MLRGCSECNEEVYKDCVHSRRRSRSAGGQHGSEGESFTCGICSYLVPVCMTNRYTPAEVISWPIPLVIPAGFGPDGVAE